MRYVVTGGAGFIGSHVAEGLLRRGDGAVVLDDFSTGREANLDGLRGDLEVVHGDVRIVRADLLALASDRVTGDVVNVATGRGVTIEDLAARHGRIVGCDATPTHEKKRAGEVLHPRADVARALELLGFAPEVPLDDGLRATLAWFRAAGGA